MLRSLLLKKTKINLYSAWLLFLSSFLLSTQEYVLTGICGAEVKALGQEHCEVKRELWTLPSARRAEAWGSQCCSAAGSGSSAQEWQQHSPAPALTATLLPLRKLRKLKLSLWELAGAGRGALCSPLLGSAAPLKGRQEKGPQLPGLAVPWWALSVSLWRRPSFSVLQASRRKGLC